MKTIILIFSIFMASIVNAQNVSDFYSLKCKTIDEQDFDFSTLRGKKILIVNTASKCGYTPQYKDLEAVYKQYGGEKFMIIGFPSNDFLSQEPGTNNDIKEFCAVNYGVSFPMMSKISVKGDDMHPVYKWLTDKTMNGVKDSKVKWNFQKYLIDEKGNLVMVLDPSEKPNSETIINWINGKQ